MSIWMILFIISLLVLMFVGVAAGYLEAQENRATKGYDGTNLFDRGND